MGPGHGQAVLRPSEFFRQIGRTRTALRYNNKKRFSAPMLAFSASIGSAEVNLGTVIDGHIRDLSQRLIGDELTNKSCAVGQ